MHLVQQPLLTKRKGIAMKPSWDDAPEWASYLAMDDGGEWYWHEEMPVWSGVEWSSDGYMAFAMMPLMGQQTMEDRP